MNKQKKGLASASPETRSRIASMGGKALAKNREHMRAIGKKGGKTTSSDREFMSKIGKIGGSRGKK